VLYIVANEPTLRSRVEEAARDFFSKAKDSSVETILAFAADVPTWWDTFASTGQLPQRSRSPDRQRGRPRTHQQQRLRARQGGKVESVPSEERTSHPSLP
jgi:hypothetical protein